MSGGGADWTEVAKWIDLGEEPTDEEWEVYCQWWKSTRDPAWDSEPLTAPQIIRHHNRVLSKHFVQLKTFAELNFGAIAAAGRARRA